METVAIRPLRHDDAEAAVFVFFDAVHRGAADFYSAEERAAWAGDRPDPQGWIQRFEGIEGFAAEVGGRLVGFMTLDADGLIDLAFVSPDFAREGLGRRLLEAVEARALAQNTLRLTTDASKVAKPFFERMGWKVEREQTVIRRDVALTNYRMSKHLRQEPPGTGNF